MGGPRRNRQAESAGRIAHFEAVCAPIPGDRLRRRPATPIPGPARRTAQADRRRAAAVLAHVSLPPPAQERWGRWVWLERHRHRWSCPDLRCCLPHRECRPEFERQARCPANSRPAPPIRPGFSPGEHAAAISTLARISAPVLSPCMASSSSRSRLRPTAERSIAWPPAMPAVPLASARISIIFKRASELTPAARSRASNEKASTCSASPASMAVASSKARCVVGWPRRRASSSMAGRSS